MSTIVTDVQRLLIALLGPASDAEDAFQQLLLERSIDTAVGVQLDAIGKIVGRLREGVTDDELYRRYIRAQIAMNKSDGLIEDMLTIADLVVYEDDATYVVDATGDASFELRVEGVAIDYDVASILIAYLRRAVAAGVRVVLTFETDDSAEMFTYADDDDTPEVSATAGWSDSTALTSGGQYASALE